MSKEYLFSAHSYKIGDGRTYTPIEVQLSFGRTLKAELPEAVERELNRIISDWVKAEEKRAISNPLSLQHHDCCSCGSCGVTDHEAW